MSEVVVENDDRAEAERKAQFERVMAYATQRAWVTGTEDDVMSTLFDVLVGVGEHDGGDDVDEGKDLGL
jgi:hypothetical protein